MISSLNGKVEYLSADYAVIDVGGVGFTVFMPTSSLTSIGTAGSPAKVFTHLHVREDNLTLFGFATPQELELFKVLINVSGLGPKLALAMLSAMDTEQLSLTIASGNAELLTSIPGIGKKMANRLVLELKDKVAGGMVTSADFTPAEGNGEVISALTALGFSASEAASALASLPKESASLPIEEKIKLALASFEQ